ncbi:hypothetical protein TrRE_jg7651 [Triparma retinervis]|uniref:Amidase domain-containing protein n=1 Tax=Triparma retinervis TaxID=2557542 RepID=A0A9W7C9I0_9STRA|nr:hypothetical protein TrRE_jg7651 [Triparma retinervis]
MLESYTPSFSADVVEALKAGGAILVGQTNMDEFGMGSATTNSAMGPSINPLPHLHPPSSSTSSPPNLTPGGSSGGSASSVAWRSSFASIGSDTGGSVRLPAAHTNTTGFKPTYGSISRFGLIPYASSLDTVGLITPTPSDAKLLFDMPPPVLRCWSSTASLLSSLGSPVDVLPPSSLSPETVRSSLAAYYVIACAEASSNLSKYDGVRYGSRLRDGSVGFEEEYEGTRGAFLGEEVRRRVACGDAVLEREGSHYLKANILRNKLRDDLNKALELFDFILIPTQTSPPFDLDDPEDKIDQNSVRVANILNISRPAKPPSRSR